MFAKLLVESKHFNKGDKVEVVYFYRDTGIAEITNNCGLNEFVKVAELFFLRGKYDVSHSGKTIK